MWFTSFLLTVSYAISGKQRLSLAKVPLQFCKVSGLNFPFNFNVDFILLSLLG